MLKIMLKDREGRLLHEAQTPGEELALVVDREYEAGDTYVIEGAKYVKVQMDVTLQSATVYAPNSVMHWTVPFGADRDAYAPFAFAGKRHLIRVWAKRASEEMHVVSRNSHDLRGDTDFFPHATANIETRGESCFAARNVIDGVHMNPGHGEWPYQSWGIGTREDAQLRIDFGRRVAVKGVRVLLRADFPHDAWFKAVTVRDDEGKETRLELVKTDAWQDFPLDTVTGSLVVDNLEKADDPSPFPSLRGIEVLGCET
ncbi:MAG: carbohydrate-binding protein [Clostridia bacterium]|nr:carbohydrate-binding protein [Clostridia bacterium]